MIFKKEKNAVEEAVKAERARCIGIVKQFINMNKEAKNHQNVKHLKRVARCIRYPNEEVQIDE